MQNLLIHRSKLTVLLFLLLLDNFGEAFVPPFFNLEKFFEPFFFSETVFALLACRGYCSLSIPREWLVSYRPLKLTPFSPHPMTILCYILECTLALQRHCLAEILNFNLYNLCNEINISAPPVARICTFKIIIHIYSSYCVVYSNCLLDSNLFWFELCGRIFLYK